VSKGKKIFGLIPFFICVPQALLAQGIIHPEKLSGYQMEILEEVNKARWTPRYCGRVFFESADPVGYAFEVDSMVKVHAQDMANNNLVMPIGSNGSSPEDRVRAFGGQLNLVSEIVFGGAESPEQVVNEWLEDAGTCSALMVPEATHMAIGRVLVQGQKNPAYWDVVFLSEN